jgi:hypothetical protein
MKVWSQITMCFGRIILPIETNESTIGTHNDTIVYEGKIIWLVQIYSYSNPVWIVICIY